MQRTTFLASLCLAFSAVCANAEPVEATITDEAGDQFGHDMTKTVVSGDGSSLNFDVTMVESPVKDYGIDSGNVIIVYLDTDNDADTGEHPLYWKEHGGFEYSVWIAVCDEGSQYCLENSEEEGGRVQLTVSDMTDENFMAEPDVHIGDRVDGPTFTGSIPYEAIGVEPGQTIRVWVVEAMDISNQEPKDLSGQATLTAG